MRAYLIRDMSQVRQIVPDTGVYIQFTANELQTAAQILEVLAEMYEAQGIDHSPLAQIINNITDVMNWKPTIN